MNQRNVPELLLLASFFLPVLQVPKESWEAPSRAERSAQSWSPRARSPWRGGPRRWVPSTRWAPESVCLAGGLRSQTCRRRAKGELRALAKDAAFGTTVSAGLPCACHPGFLFPKGALESGASSVGEGERRARCRGCGTLRGHAARSGWVQALQRPDLVDAEPAAFADTAATRTSHGLVGGRGGG